MKLLIVCATVALMGTSFGEGIALKLPARLYTPDTIAGLKARPVRNPLGLSLWNVREDAGLAALKSPALDDLVRFIPLTPPGAFWSAEYICPFCGNRWQYGRWKCTDVLSEPFSYSTLCCGLRIHEDEAEWPTSGRWATRNVLRVPHLDGQERPYTFLVPDSDVGKQFTTVPNRKGRDSWFCPAMDVWNRRMTCLRDEIIPSLAAVVLKNPDEATRTAARRLLVRIFDRLADVLPSGTVCQSSRSDISYGIAKDVTKSRYLSASEYRATPRHRRPPWQDGSYCTLGIFGSSAQGGWQNGTFATFAVLLEAWDVVRDSAEARPFVAKIERGVVDEIGFCLSWSVPHEGNTEYVWYNAAMRVAIALQDEWYVLFAIERIRESAVSEIYSDGLITEGAFRPYAGLVCNNFRFVGNLRDAGICDFYEDLPFLKNVERRLNEACRTLWGGSVSPGDDMALGWLPSFAAWGGKPYAAPDYGRFRGENYPEWALTMLRCGAASNRFEICMDNAKHIGHGHSARLNLELFYEGTPLMPELGYCQTTLAYDRGFGLELKERYARERGLEFCRKPPNHPSHPGQWGLWYTYGNMDITHVGATIDWDFSMWDRDHASWTPRFATADSPESVEGFVQFAEGAFEFGKPASATHQMFNRQLVAVTLPSGKALAVDFMRLYGGRRHQTFAHAFSPKAGEPLAAEGLARETSTYADYSQYAMANGCDMQTNRTYSARAVFYPYLRNLETASTMAGDVWRMSFKCRPDAYAPVTEEGKDFTSAWTASAVPPIDFDMWGMSAGGQAQTEVLTMKAPCVTRQIEKAMSGKRPYQNYLIPFDGMLDIVSEIRTSDSNGLKSCFARVYAPYRAEGQSGAVRAVRSLGEGAVRIETTDGPLYVATAADGYARRKTGGLTLNGRMGAVLPSMNMIRLYDGESIELEDGGKVWKAKVAPTQRLRLREVIGDISGAPHEHALVVEGGELATDATWKGRWITVEHPGSRIRSDSYEVASVTKIGDGVYRVDLANEPTFATYRSRVKRIDKQGDGTCAYWGERWNNKEAGADGAIGRMHFLRTGWTPMYEMTSADPVRRGGGFTSDRIVVSDPPPAGAEPQVGDAFVLSRTKAGDVVVFPSSLSARGIDSGDGTVVFDVVATAPYEVSVANIPFWRRWWKRLVK